MAVEDASSLAALQREIASLKRDLAETGDELAAARGREADGLARETATSEILRIISSSPTDLQAVLQAVATNAARLCDSLDAQIYRVDGDVIRLASAQGLLKEPLGATRPLDRGSVVGRA